MRRMLFVLALAGCSNPFYVQLEASGHMAMHPVPAIYGEWHRQVVECVGVDSNFATIRWYTAREMSHGGRAVEGHALIRARAITIRADHIMSEHVVRHEMVHVVLQRGNEIHDERGNVPCEVGFIT